jgi:hypothetical protein
MVDRKWNDSEDTPASGDQGGSKKPIARSVEKKLKKLRARLARKEAEEKVSYKIPPSRTGETPKHHD